MPIAFGIIVVVLIAMCWWFTSPFFEKISIFIEKEINRIFK